MLDNLVQLWILVFSGGAALMISRTDRWHRWGHVMGLASQPAYVYTTIAHDQWGMLVLTAWYAYHWYAGIRRRFG